MGDFNDNPTNKSLTLLTKENSYITSFKLLFNPKQAFLKKVWGVWLIETDGICLIKSWSINTS
jgi:hypothetical protein